MSLSFNDLEMGLKPCAPNLAPGPWKSLLSWRPSHVNHNARVRRPDEWPETWNKAVASVKNALGQRLLIVQLAPATASALRTTQKDPQKFSGKNQRDIGIWIPQTNISKNFTMPRFQCPKKSTENVHPTKRKRWVATPWTSAKAIFEPPNCLGPNRFCPKYAFPKIALSSLDLRQPHKLQSGMTLKLGKRRQGCEWYAVWRLVKDRLIRNKCIISVLAWWSSESITQAGKFWTITPPFEHHFLEWSHLKLKWISRDSDHPFSKRPPQLKKKHVSEWLNFRWGTCRRVLRQMQSSCIASLDQQSWGKKP